MNCSQAQWKISRAEDDSHPWPDELTAHVRGCDTCRHFADTTRQLRRPSAEPAPIGWHTRIMASVKSVELVREPVGLLVRWAFVAVILAAGALWISHQPAEDATLLSTVGVEMDRVTAQLDAVAAAPYTDELSRLRQDMQSARDFLLSRLESLPTTAEDPS